MSEPMNPTEEERRLHEARERLEVAREKRAREWGPITFLLPFYEAVLQAERALAASRGEPHTLPWEWPVRSSFSIEPSPLVLTNAMTTKVLYEAVGSTREEPRMGVLTFDSCASTKLGDPNDEVIEGHPLFGKGIDVGGAYIVQNSPWHQELESTNKVHSQYDPALWRSLKHYLLFFKDHTFECVARSVSGQTVEGSMRHVSTQVLLGLLR